MHRLFADRISKDTVPTDKDGLIRMDDLEMQPEIQDKVTALWNSISAENLSECADIRGYQQGFNELFGFDVPGVDYETDVDPIVPIKSIE